MKVYIVYDSDPANGDNTPLAVFSTENLALDYIDLFGSETYDIEEYELDEAMMEIEYI